MRIRKRRCCSSSLIENQYLTSLMPERTSILSNSGTREKFIDLLGRRKSHDAFDASAIVPGAGEQHDLAADRQVGNVALEVPLDSSRGRMAPAAPPLGTRAD